MGNFLIKIKPKLNLIYNFNWKLATHFVEGLNAIHRFLFKFGGVRCAALRPCTLFTIFRCFL